MRRWCTLHSYYHINNFQFSFLSRLLYLGLALFRFAEIARETIRLKKMINLRKIHSRLNQAQYEVRASARLQHIISFLIIFVVGLFWCSENCSTCELTLAAAAATTTEPAAEWRTECGHFVLARVSSASDITIIHVFISFAGIRWDGSIFTLCCYTYIS